MGDRAITGGTGCVASVRDEMAAGRLGFNDTEGSNTRYEVRLAS